MARATAGVRPARSARPTEARLARLHLRTGALALARAELETLAGTVELDPDSLLDLAEIRWRTDDLPGAGVAAQAYIAAGGEAALGFVIAAEAAAALGRPGEAKRLAARALERLDRPLDELFAGLPRSAAWPTDPSDPGEPAGILFEAGATSAPAGAAAGAAVAAARAGLPQPPRDLVGPAPTAGPASGTSPVAGPGLWDDGAAVALDDLLADDPAAELEAGRAALAAGEAGRAAIHLAIAVRLDPGLAPAVLELAGAGRAPALDLVRGDALRLVGHELEARRAWAAATRAVAAHDEDPPSGSASGPAAGSAAGPAAGSAAGSQPGSAPGPTRPTPPVRPRAPARPGRTSTTHRARPTAPDLPPGETT